MVVNLLAACRKSQSVCVGEGVDTGQGRGPEKEKRTANKSRPKPNPVHCPPPQLKLVAYLNHSSNELSTTTTPH